VISYSADAEKLTVLDNGNVGIGTTSPSRLLSVSDDGTYSAYFSGRVGIGTNAPGEKLEVSSGNIKAISGSDYVLINPSSGGVPTLSFFNNTVLAASLSAPATYLTSDTAFSAPSYLAESSSAGANINILNLHNAAANAVGNAVSLNFLPYASAGAGTGAAVRGQMTNTNGDVALLFFDFCCCRECSRKNENYTRR